MYWQAFKYKLRRKLLVSLAIAVVIGLAAMFLRSETIKGVRDIDQTLITNFVKASLNEGNPHILNQILTQGLDSALKDESYKDPYVGVAVWRNDEQIIGNHSLLRGKAWVDIKQAGMKHDVRFIVEDLKVSNSDDHYRIAFFRPELKYQIKWKNFYYLPFVQAADPYSLAVQWSTFRKKVGGFSLSVFIFVFFLIYLFELFFIRKASKQKKKIEKNTKYLSSLQKKIYLIREESKDLIQKENDFDSQLEKLQKEIDEKKENSEQRTILENEAIKINEEKEKVIQNLKIIQELQDERINELSDEVRLVKDQNNELESKAAGYQNQQELQQEIKSLREKRNLILSLWDKDVTEWDKRRAIEKEISPDYLPFTAFLAMISIERYLREETGHLDDKDIKIFDLLRNSDIPDETEYLLENQLIPTRNKWFHGSIPSHESDYMNFIDVAKRINANIASKRNIKH